MTTKTTIEWTATRHADGTVTAGTSWNPVRGCQRVSEGCRHCYAERMALRFSGPGQPYEGLVRKVGNEARWTGTVQLVYDVLEEPLHWRTPRRVFVNSMADLFHEDVPFEFIARVFAVMAKAREHTFQVLTKRPARMLQFMATLRDGCILDVPREAGEALWGSYILPLPNVWLGVSVEDQATADERVPLLLRTPAAVRWLSCEPLLGPVDLTGLPCGDVFDGEDECYYDALYGYSYWPDGDFGVYGPALSWVVVGGESGPGARPMHPDWARRIRDHCVQSRVPYFFKQRGEWTWDYPQSMSLAHRAETYRHGQTFYRVGKSLAGRLLDGREWNEYPQEVTRAR